MKFKGTKGEFEKDLSMSKGRVAWISIKNQKGNTIAEFKGRHCGVTNIQMNANVKLMVASQKLLEACIKRMKWSKKYPSSKIFSGSQMQKMIKESDEIDLLIEQAIEDALT